MVSILLEAVRNVSLKLRHRRLRARSGASPQTIDGTDAKPGAGTAKPTGRTKHPTEVPFIASSDYGKVIFEFKNKDAVGFVDEKGEAMQLSDLYEHLIVFGGSGTGKTYSILQPLWEEWFRSTHLPDGPERDAKKFGALVIEAKGDFKDKTWSLAQKYGRMDDCIYFGPTHRDVVYDMFGDPTESPLQKSNKMVAILKAFSDGKSGQDPFWDNAARKLFLNIFIMHETLRLETLAVAGTAEEKKFATPPMSFQLLNLLLMDRGIPRNQAELSRAAEEYSREYNTFMGFAKDFLDVSVQLEAELAFWLRHASQLQAQIAAEQSILEKAEPGSDTFRRAQGNLAAYQSIEETLSALMRCPPSEDDPSQPFLAEMLASVRQAIKSMENPSNDIERRTAFDSVAPPVARVQQALMQRAGLSRELEENLPKMAGTRAALFALSSRCDSLAASHAKLVKIMSKPQPQPANGALKGMVAQYEELLKKRKAEVQLDPLWAYFNEEYLSMANEKTSGSVAMVASNMVAMFVHPPFSEIFASEANFTFNQVIDEGKIVYLDMPTALYGAAATVASLALKIDFFRAMLSRTRLRTRLPSGEMGDRIVNQDRPMSYFCDEFASIVSTGDDTGEAGFMDKVREFKCACLLGTQSIPMLLKKLSDNEVDAILTNTAVKLFLRNMDVKTNEYASKLLGTEIKVTSNLTQGAAEALFADQSKATGSRGFSTSYNRSARFDHGDLSKLQKGNAIVALNPRFGKNQIQKLAFMGKAIPKADQTPPYGIKHTHPI